MLILTETRTMTEPRILHIFRRDLRIKDNTSLYHAMQDGTVHPCFIVDPRQVGDGNKYRSLAAIQFMRESLNELSQEIAKRGGQLNFFYGVPEEVVEKLLVKNLIDGIYHNKDYTPFSRKRDTAIEQVCKKHNATYRSFDDTLLNPPGTVLRKDKKPYVVFTPFHEAARQYPVKKPIAVDADNFALRLLPGALQTIPEELPIVNRITQAMPGGRPHALTIL